MALTSYSGLEQNLHFLPVYHGDCHSNFSLYNNQSFRAGSTAIIPVYIPWPAVLWEIIEPILRPLLLRAFLCQKLPFYAFCHLA